MSTPFTVESALRATAGTFVLVSLALGAWVHPAFLLFTAFVGANLLQSAFTGWCPAMWFFARVCHLESAACPAGGRTTGF